MFDRKAIVRERLRDKKYADIYSELLIECEDEIKKLKKEIDNLLRYETKITKRKSRIQSAAQLLKTLLEEGEISDANLRLLVNKIIIKECEDKLDIHIKLNIGFDS